MCWNTNGKLGENWLKFLSAPPPRIPNWIFTIVLVIPAQWGMPNAHACWIIPPAYFIFAPQTSNFQFIPRSTKNWIKFCLFNAKWKIFNRIGYRLQGKVPNMELYLYYSYCCYFYGNLLARPVVTMGKAKAPRIQLKKPLSISSALLTFHINF